MLLDAKLIQQQTKQNTFPIELSWHPPPSFIKLNTDVAFRGNPGESGIGDTLRDSNATFWPIVNILILIQISLLNYEPLEKVFKLLQGIISKTDH